MDSTKAANWRDTCYEVVCEVMESGWIDAVKLTDMMARTKQAGSMYPEMTDFVNALQRWREKNPETQSV